MFNFFEEQLETRAGEKEKFELKTLRSLHSENDIINSSISDLYADAIIRYKLLKDRAQSCDTKSVGLDMISIRSVS